jgi:hypothetical protein
MNSKAFLGAAALLSLSLPALAAGTIPKVSGIYDISYVESCQAIISTTTGPSGGVGSVNNGKLSDTVGTADFNPTTGMVTITGFQNIGDLLIIQNIGGNAMTQSAVSDSWPYSNDASSVTFTIGGTPTVFHATFGKIANGVVKQAILLGTPGNGTLSPNCTSVITALQQ